MVLKFMWILVSLIDKVFCCRIRDFGVRVLLTLIINWCLNLIIKSNYYRADIIGWNFIVFIKREKKGKEKKNHTCNKLQVEGCDIGLYSITRRGKKN